MEQDILVCTYSHPSSARRVSLEIGGCTHVSFHPLTRVQTDDDVLSLLFLLFLLLVLVVLMLLLLVRWLGMDSEPYA